MRSRLARVLVTAVVLLLVAVIYGWRLHDAPVYLTTDEIIIGLNGHAIATTGHDLRGAWLPLFFRIDEFRLKGTIWYQPIIMYATAAVLLLAPLTEWAIRLPAVLVGVADVILTFFVARLLFRRTSVAICAAAMLALSPAHFVHSRFAMDYVFPLPFLLAWLLAQAQYERSRDPRLVFVATLCLGLGLYSYIAAVAMMPVYLATTGWLLWRAAAPWRHFAAALAGFLIPLLLFAAWVVGHPTIVAETFARYDLGNPARLGWVGRTELYWNYFSPSYLFFSGGADQVFAPGSSGVFLLPLAVLIPLGAHRALRSTAPIEQALLVGFVSAPLAAILLDAESAINRSLEVVPFGVLLAAAALDRLVPASTAPSLGRAHRLRLACVALLLVAGLVQWRSFSAHYFGDYRVRSAPLFQGNIETAIQAILDRQPAGQGAAVYLSEGLDLWWTFYVRKHDRPDLLGRTVAVRAADYPAIPASSFVLVNIQTPAGATQAKGFVASGFSTIRAVEDIDGSPSFVVLQR